MLFLPGLAGIHRLIHFFPIDFDIDGFQSMISYSITMGQMFLFFSSVHNNMLLVYNSLIKNWYKTIEAVILSGCDIFANQI